jgi:hypothetical protein
MAKMVQHLPNKCEALRSNPSTTKKKVFLKVSSMTHLFCGAGGQIQGIIHAS